MTRPGWCRVKQLPDTFRPARAGILLFFQGADGNAYIIAGIDANSKDITDFGGQVAAGDANGIATALREYREESFDLIEINSGNLSPESVCIFDASNLLIFVRVRVDDPTIIVPGFNTLMYTAMTTLGISSELSGVTIIEREDFKTLVGMYNKVREFILSVVNAERDRAGGGEFGGAGATGWGWMDNL